MDAECLDRLVDSHVAWNSDVRAVVRSIMKLTLDTKSQIQQRSAEGSPAGEGRGVKQERAESNII